MSRNGNQMETIKLTVKIFGLLKDAEYFQAKFLAEVSLEI